MSFDLLIVRLSCHTDGANLDEIAAQRFALLPLGREWILLGSREKSKPEKMLLENAT
jgi:hypothetical protein